MKAGGIMLLSFFVISTLHAQTWKWASAPQAGSHVEVILSDLPEEGAPFSVVYYTFDDHKIKAADLTLIPDETPGIYRVPATIPHSSHWICVALKNEYNEVISASHEYVTNPSGKTKAWAVDKALGVSRYARTVGLERNDEEALTLFRDAMITDPSWMTQHDVLNAYYFAAKNVESDSDLDNVKVFVTSVSHQPKDKSEKLLIQSWRIAKDMEDSTLMLTLRKSIDKQFPKSILAQEDAVTAYRNTKDLAQKIKLRDQFIAKYPLTDDNRPMHDQLTSGLIQSYADANNWDQVVALTDNIQDPMVRARVCNQYAWQLSGESTDTEGSHYDIAEKLSSVSLKLQSPDVPPPAYMTKLEWARQLENNKASYEDTYALIRFKQGHVNEAIDHQLFAATHNKFEDVEINERYIIYLESAKRWDELSSVAEDMIIKGKASPRIKDIHKAYWTQQASKDMLYDQYVRQLDNIAKARLEEAIKKMWQDDPAAGFTLKNLQGIDVSLEQYKGKTVVLDFWATWCGPCKASFPGMKKAVEHYAADKDVAFLFIDTWESDENVHKRVSDFIQQNNYPFHVLMDMDDAVVEGYKVDGIPTKFVIGPDQKIHFTSIGYGGNPDELLEEIKIMVEMARGKTKT